MEKLMLLKPKYGRKKVIFYLKYAFCKQKVVVGRNKVCFLVEIVFLEGNRRGSGEKRQKDVAKTKKRQGKFGG